MAGKDDKKESGEQKGKAPVKEEIKGKDADALVKMTATEPLLHDGDRILPGEDFEASRKQAAVHLKNKTAKEA